MKEQIHEKRIFGLDVIRTIAIVMVVIAHSTFILKVKPFNHKIQTNASIASTAAPSEHAASQQETIHKNVQPAIRTTQLRRSKVWALGELGVELFFVLSGFLIGNILIKQFTRDKVFTFKQVGNFWVRRWLRTLPIYWLILSIAVFSLSRSGLEVDSTILSYYVFVHNLFKPHPAFFREAWSLAVEEWFYLTVPVVLYIAARLFAKAKKEKILWYVCMSYLVFFTLLRCINSANPLYGADYDTTIRKIVMFRLDAIMYGVIMALMLKYRYEQVMLRKNTLLLISILGVSITTYFMYYYEIGYIHSDTLGYKLFNTIFLYSLLPFVFSLCLPFAFAYKTLGGKAKFIEKAITHVSKVSYSIYLTHYSLIFKGYFINVNAQTYWMAFGWYLLYWFTIISIATFLYKFVEQPILKLRDIKFGQEKAAMDKKVSVTEL